MPVTTRQMASGIARRQFIGALGGASLAWPITARAQQPRMPVVGYLSSNRADAVSQFTSPFREGLAAAGFVEDKDVSIEYRWADRNLERVPTLALELIQLRVNVIFAVGHPVLLAVRSVTQTVPIVAVDLNSDPVDSGMAAGLAHPGGNVTGVFLAFPEFATKWLELLKETNPQLSRVAVLWDPSTGPMQQKAVKGAAELLKVPLEFLEVQSPSDFDKAFKAASRRGADAVLMLLSAVTFSMLQKAAELAILHNLPAVSMATDFARAGGLFAYGPDFPGIFRQGGVMTAKVLRGTKPADLPIERPTKFVLVINLKTAKALGLTIPQTLLVAADEVIE
jgi:putative ABC transport system substrate-binding protein